MCRALMVFFTMYYFFFLRKNPVTKSIPSTINNIPPIILRRTYRPKIKRRIPRTVKIFSSLVETSRRVQILLPSSLVSSLNNTFASFSTFFAKVFALSSTVLTVFFVAATTFLTGFLVGIISLCKGIKGYYRYIQSFIVCKCFL